MSIEIERKFLLKGDAWRSLAEPAYMCQGYLNTDTDRTVRVRITGEVAQLTIKGRSRGASRAEFEYEIPIDDAKQLMQMCEQPIIEKHRSRIPAGDIVWEVDEFLGENRGLIVAEVELQSEDQSLELPDWVGDEVTGDERYYNSRLATNPFQSW